MSSFLFTLEFTSTTVTQFSRQETTGFYDNLMPVGMYVKVKKKFIL